MNKIREIARLIYLRKTLDERIDEFITSYLLRDKELDIERIKETLLYHIEDNLEFYKQGR